LVVAEKPVDHEILAGKTQDSRLKTQDQAQIKNGVELGQGCTIFQGASSKHGAGGGCPGTSCGGCNQMSASQRSLWKDCVRCLEVIGSAVAKACKMEQETQA